MSNQKDPKDFLYEGERLDDLQRDGMYIIQNPKWFCFGMDAVLLSAYAKVKEGEKCPVCGSLHHPQLAVIADQRHYSVTAFRTY